MVDHSVFFKIFVLPLPALVYAFRQNLCKRLRREEYLTLELANSLDKKSLYEVQENIRNRYCSSSYVNFTFSSYLLGGIAFAESEGKPAPPAVRAGLSEIALRARTGKPAPLNPGAERGRIENREFLRPADLEVKPDLVSEVSVGIAPALAAEVQLAC